MNFTSSWHVVIWAGQNGILYLVFPSHPRGAVQAQIVKELLQRYPDQHMLESFMIREIMEITDEAAIPDLLALLDGNPRVQVVALIALGRIGGCRVLPALVTHLADSDRSVRYKALAILSTMRKAQAYDIASSASEEEWNAKERQCWAWWQQ